MSMNPINKFLDIGKGLINTEFGVARKMTNQRRPQLIIGPKIDIPAADYPLTISSQTFFVADNRIP